jgi:poly-gamma-glutamate capsule biosynthesis protein CapA/YwtB (metallophosphatase superfamily)
MSTNLKKQLLWSAGVFALIFFWTNIFFDYGSQLLSKNTISRSAAVSGVVVTGSPVAETQPVVKENIRLAFVGDIMLDRGVKYFVNKSMGGDYNELFVKVKDQLKSYDILFGNLEGPVSDKGSDGGSLYSFRMDPKVIPVLNDVGFDVFSVANNHTFNWGEGAFTDTLDRLTDAGIAYVGGGHDGQDAYQEKLIEAKGIKIAYLAFSEFRDGAVITASTRPGIAFISDEEIKNSVSKARSKADLVVASFHFGEEYQTQPNNYQQKYAELAMDSGADLVIGSHPHVVQTIGRYKNSYIIYSLGNFIFDQAFSKETMQGGLLEVEVNSETKQIEKVTLKKVFLNKMFQIESIE